METDEDLLMKYRKGVDGWWASMSQSENPLWYLIYQLIYPDKEIEDYYGNNVLGNSILGFKSTSYKYKKISSFL